MAFSQDRKGMSQIMTIILTTVIATMIAAIIGLSAGDIIPGAFDDTEHQSCMQQIETTCQTSEGDQSAPAACRGIDLDEEFSEGNFGEVSDFDSDSMECEGS